MDWVTTGADTGTMLTGLSAVTATVLWGRTRIREWRAERDARRTRNWNGYIIRENVPTWFVRVIEDESNKSSERVTLEVINSDGTPNLAMAHLLRQLARNDGMLSRSPSPAQWRFLDDLRRARFGAPGGYPIT